MLAPSSGQGCSCLSLQAFKHRRMARMGRAGLQGAGWPGELALQDRECFTAAARDGAGRGSRGTIYLCSLLLGTAQRSNGLCYSRAGGPPMGSTAQA